MCYSCLAGGLTARGSGRRRRRAGKAMVRAPAMASAPAMAMWAHPRTRRLVTSLAVSNAVMTAGSAEAAMNCSAG